MSHLADRRLGNTTEDVRRWQKFPAPEVKNGNGHGAAPVSVDKGYRPVVAQHSGLSSSFAHLELLYPIVDVCLVLLSGFFSFCLRFSILGRSFGAGPKYIDLNSAGVHSAFLFIFAALVVMACQTQDLYKTLQNRSALDESIGVAKALGAATLIMALFIYLSGSNPLSRFVLITADLIDLPLLIGWRLARRSFVSNRIGQGYWCRHALIVGAGRMGQLVAKELEERSNLGYTVVGFLDQENLSEPRLLGGFEDLASIARTCFVDDVFITTAATATERQAVKSLVRDAIQSRLNVHLVPDLYDGLGLGATMDQLGGLPVMAIHQQPIPALGMFIKRAIDICVSSMVLLISLPVFAITALVIKLDSPGPVFYLSRRLGKKARPFVCIKFRTMVKDAEEQVHQLLPLNERSRVLFKITNDPRVTRIGKFLRKFSLDELPQLWNVLRGDMSLVGPRPGMPVECDQYGLENLRRLDVMPGITGLWQVKARRDPSFENYVCLDLEYIENWSLWLDLKILLKTIPVVLQGSGS